QIQNDPGLEICPDFASDAFGFIRTPYAQANDVTEEVATQRLQDAWAVGNNARKVAWAARLEIDRVAREVVQQEAREAEQQLAAAAEAERLETERKKPKMREAPLDEYITRASAPKPSQWAIERIKKFLHLDLYNLTEEGCCEAAAQVVTAGDDTLGLTKINDIIALRPLDSLRAPRRIIHDTDLTWRQFSMAKNILLMLISKYGWPERNVDMLGMFFTRIETHPMRYEPHGERILLAYQAQARREWHEALDAGGGFNIAMICDSRLQTVYNQVWSQVRLEESVTVS
ncbi:hypothetical protein BOTBODRAFT_86076, partial [Botryobasidium botryosum FD-172 SS1]